MRISPLAILAAFLIALGLTACGSGSTEGTEGGVTSAEATGPEETPPTDGDGSDGKQGESGDGGEGTDEDGAGGSGEGGSPDGGQEGGEAGKSGEGKGESGTGAGGGNAQPGEPGPPSGDELRSYGEEADDSDRQAASDVLKGYVQAYEDRDWQGVCARLSKGSIEAFEKIAENNPQLKGKGCVGIFTTAAKTTNVPKFKGGLDGLIDSLRVDGNDAYAIYSDAQGDEFSINMSREGSEWKVKSFGPQELS
ncbi:MAG: hypothetical protein R2725_03200 [Solirubrobacterales bacterium]